MNDIFFLPSATYHIWVSESLRWMCDFKRTTALWRLKHSTFKNGLAHSNKCIHTFFTNQSFILPLSLSLAFTHTHCFFSLFLICFIPPASSHIRPSVPNLDAAFSPFLFPLSSNILIKFFFCTLLLLIYSSFFFPLSFFFVPPPSPHAADNWTIMRWWKQSHRDAGSPPLALPISPGTAFAFCFVTALLTCCQ